eukprot:TRINITY_DN2911_c0_g1_i2.p1 TRINITY_DN2911_c0_g1~~TRINITY_DN2911_c0_g1_i2.p1  ORF type:complete len:452 (-),score=89.49 TRINITY_DN2911_c0_g1_i2:87-1442(-)
MGTIVLSLLHPKSLEFVLKRGKRRERKGILKLGSRDTRKSFSYGQNSSINVRDDPEEVETKKTARKKDKGFSISTFSKNLKNKITKKESSNRNTNSKRVKIDATIGGEDESTSLISTSRSSKKTKFNTLTKRTKGRPALLGDNTSDDDSLMSISEMINDEESFDVGSLTTSVMEGLVRLDSGDIWVRISPKEPITKVKHLLKCFKENTSRFSECNFNIIKEPSVNEMLLDLEDKIYKKHFTFSILYRKEGAKSYNDILMTENMSTNFEEFLEWIADPINLVGWEAFNGGLSTGRFAEHGEESYYTSYKENEIMFHVGPLLPSEASVIDHQSPRTTFIEKNEVLIVFDEDPFPVNPSIFTSNIFQVLVVVRKTKSSPLHYQISVASKIGINEHHPVFPLDEEFEATPHLKTLLLSKFINACRASAQAPQIANRTFKKRKAHLDNLHAHLTEQ